MANRSDFGRHNSTKPRVAELRKGKIVPEKRYRPSLVGPLILIAIGVLLLLNQMGRLPWSVWGSLWRFWPVILILIGLEILVGTSRSIALYIAGLLVAIAVLGGIIGYAIYRGGQPAGPRPVTGTETVLEALRDADRGHVVIRFGVGNLAIGSLADPPNFVEGKIEYGRYSLQAEKSFDVSNGRASFSLQAHSQSIPFWMPGENIGDNWKIEFTPRIPIELNIDAGVGKVEMDLSDLKVTTLNLKTGVGETVITFPAAAGLTRASIQAGVGQVTVQIPDGVGTRIRVSKGLGSVHTESRRFTRSGDEYVSTDYRTAEDKLELEIKGGIGNITIQ